MQPTFERKFVGPPASVPLAVAWLRHVCLAHPQHPEADIVTVYYDTPLLDACEEKLNGDFAKTKYRLRWYVPELSPDPARCTVFAEVKRKAGDGRHKQRVRLAVERARLGVGLDDPSWLALLQGAGLDDVPPGNTNLAPTVQLSYHRWRFLCPQTLASVCLDTAIRVERWNQCRLLPLEAPDVPAAVLEFKDQLREDPGWILPLREAGFQRQGFSKYAECIRRLTWEM